MFSAFERAIAFRYLSARKGERLISITSLFSLVGIALGVAALIIVTSVMNGFRAELMARIIGLNGHLTISPERGRVLTEPWMLVERLSDLPGLVQAVPVVEGQVLLASPQGATAAAMVRGMPLEALITRNAVRRGLHAESGFNVEAPQGAIIGARLAARLRLGLGDSVTVLLPRLHSGSLIPAPKQASLRITAVLDLSMPEYDERFLYVSLDTAQRLFELGEQASRVDIVLADPRHVISELSAVRARVAEPSLRITSWREVNSRIYAAVIIERYAMFLILTLVVVVAAFNIIASLTMLVKDKEADIAILRTMGARRSAILRIFILCGALIGGSGTLIGLAIGLVVTTHLSILQQGLAHLATRLPMTAELHYLMRLPAVVEGEEVVVIALLALALSLAATLYPAWKAARLEPIEGLRRG